MLNNKTRERDNYGLLVTKSSQEKPSISSAVGEKKRLKINFIQNSPTVSNNGIDIFFKNKNSIAN